MLGVRAVVAADSVTALGAGSARRPTRPRRPPRAGARARDAGDGRALGTHAETAAGGLRGQRHGRIQPTRAGDSSSAASFLARRGLVQSSRPDALPRRRAARTPSSAARMAAPLALAAAWPGARASCARASASSPALRRHDAHARAELARVALLVAVGVVRVRHDQGRARAAPPISASVDAPPRHSATVAAARARSARVDVLDGRGSRRRAPAPPRPARPGPVWCSTCTPSRQRLGVRAHEAVQRAAAPWLPPSTTSSGRSGSKPSAARAARALAASAGAARGSAGAERRPDPTRSRALAARRPRAPRQACRHTQSAAKRREPARGPPAPRVDLEQRHRHAESARREHGGQRREAAEPEQHLRAVRAQRFRAPAATAGAMRSASARSDGAPPPAGSSGSDTRSREPERGAPRGRRARAPPRRARSGTTATSAITPGAATCAKRCTPGRMWPPVPPPASANRSPPPPAMPQSFGSAAPGSKRGVERAARRATGSATGPAPPRRATVRARS